MRLNCGSGTKRLDGFINLDQDQGWRFQDGFTFPDGSVQAITISHALCLLPLPEWSPFFDEMYRVTRPGAIVRITDDHTTHPDSPRYGGGDFAATKTSPAMVKGHLLSAGFVEVDDMTAKTGRDKTLIQNHHGVWPKVFHVEAVRGED